jgi:hypothetical protein
MTDLACTAMSAAAATAAGSRLQCLTVRDTWTKRCCCALLRCCSYSKALTVQALHLLPMCSDTAAAAQNTCVVGKAML